MRLPQATIKEAIAHPEKVARQEALNYFSDCFSRDAEVMPIAIKAIEKYGRRGAFLYVHVLANLEQSEATMDWAIQELHREEDKFQDHDSYFPALSRLLCQASPQLLIPRAKAITEAPGFLKFLLPELQDRLRIASWDADRCWKELESISAAGMSKDPDSEADFHHASRVVEKLAHHGQPFVDRILDLLQKEIEDFDNDPMVLMEEFMVILAGEMRLERAIPLIVTKLHALREVLSEQCIDALGKIGTDAAAEAVTNGWLESEWDYRLYATSALEKIHSDTTVRKCLELLPKDKDLGIRTKLADALLCQFAEEVIEPVREMVQKRAYDDTITDLMGRLVGISAVLGVEFPEYPIWKKAADEKRAIQERRTREIGRFLHDSRATASPKPAVSKEPDVLLDQKRSPILRTEKHVGRNDPCPCGSGMKFKKCCMKR